MRPVTRFWRQVAFWGLVLAFAVSAAGEETSPAPTEPTTPVPTAAPTIASDSNVTDVPTPAPTTTTNSTASPAPTTSPAPSTLSSPPTAANTTSVAPTPSPTAPAPTTTPPTVSPRTPSPTKAYIPPTDAPTPEPTKKHHNHHHHSAWRILGKTLAWLILTALFVLLFGFIMSNRYRIYYYIKSAWYSFLRLPATQWVLRKLRLARFVGGQETSLNDIIFDQDMNQGLLLSENT